MSTVLFRPLFIGLVTLLCAAPATAAIIEVNRLNDFFDINLNDGICDVDLLDPGPQCTLRAAIMTANTNPGHDTIALPPGGIFQLALGGDGGAEIGDLNITDDVDIVGFIDAPPMNAGDLPLIDAVAINDRIFNVGAGVPVTLRGLRLRGGEVAQSGGAVRSSGLLLIEQSEFAFNTANRGGAILQITNDTASGVPPLPSSLVVRDSHFELNHATLQGGAIYSSAPSLIERSSFRDNRAEALVGGGLHLQGSSATLIDSTLDGSALAAPVPGLDASIGIVAHGVFNLVLRNATLTGFDLSALDLQNLSASRRARISNSILAGGPQACRASGPDVAAADVLITHSLVQSEDGCGDFQVSVLGGVAPQLGGFANDAGSVTWHRPPADLFANVVDAGIPPDLVPGSAELACSETDQRGNPRPQDGNGDEIARCDLGAVEEGEPLTFVVNTALDAVDDSPGDGLCETLPVIGEDPCSLRAAIMEANALPGIQRIRFAEGLGQVQLTLPAAPSASGGDLDISEAVIVNGNVLDGRPMTLLEQTTPGERLFDTDPGISGPVYLRGLRLTGGDSGAGFGGALRVSGGSVLLERSELFNNFSAFAGGAVAVSGGTLNISDTDLHGNSTDERGGAAFVGSGATLRISISSLWDNQSFDGEVALATVEVEAGGSLFLANSTIALNSAGLLADQPSFLAVTNSTIAENTGFGLDAQFAPGNQVVLFASIIADNGALATPVSLKGGAAGSNCRLGNLASATVVAYEYLLASDDSCLGGSGSSFMANPLLQPLVQVSGRNSRVMQPRYAPELDKVSPALDAAPVALCSPTDQLGGLRNLDLPDIPNLDGPCDLGAVEIQTVALFANGFESD